MTHLGRDKDHDKQTKKKIHNTRDGGAGHTAGCHRRGHEHHQL
jgi:hypothetical protein